MCDLCSRNKKVFTHEHELYTAQELKKHEKFGDDNPGAVDQSGFKGHPECGFCRQRFYGDDELFAHCRDKHEKCHICDRRNGGRNPQYYENYESLEQHFKKDHFLCLETDCLEKKFVVFESEMDLKGHQLESHSNSLSKDVRKDARRVDLSSFDYRTPHQDNRGGRSGRGRGRDPNSEPIPASSAQPLRRDELAYQRQMAIASAQSVSTRTFGGQLTTRPTAAPTSTASQTRNDQPVPPIENLNLNSTEAPTAALTPQEQARRLQHEAVITRASSMLKNDTSKISDFRSRVSSYRTSAIDATALIDTFFTLFDCPPSDLGKLIKELADIYEEERKRSDLLKAWNDWRAVNEDYPSLPGPDGNLPAANPSGGGGRRILKLKSSTAQSSRSQINRQVAWGNAAPPSSRDPFPAIPAAASNPNRVGQGRVGPIPWATPSSSRPAPTASFRPAPSSATDFGPPAPRATKESFPALPAAQKPVTAMMGIHHGKRWDGWEGSGTSTPSNNPWGGGNSVNASGAACEVEGAEEGDGGKGKKKGRKG